MLSRIDRAGDLFKIPTMKILFGTVFLVFFLTISRADVLVYNNKVTTTKTGNGFALKASFSGFTVIDIAGSGFALVKVNLATETFSIFRPTNYFVLNIDGPRSKSMVLAISGSGIGSTFAKGNCTSLADGSLSGQLVTAPKTFTVTGSDVYQGNDGKNYVEEYKGSLAFNKLSTTTANASGLTFEATLSQIQSALIAQGFSEE